jgi:hypothetical protein
VSPDAAIVLVGAFASTVIAAVARINMFANSKTPLFRLEKGR